MSGGGLHRREFRAFGGAVAALVEAADPGRDLRAVPRWFRGWERRLSRFLPESELCRLNTAAGSPTRVSPTLFAALEAALAAAEWTGGLVTPTLLEPLERAGYDRSFELLAPRPDDGPAADPPPTLEHRCIALSRGSRRVTLPQGLRLDLGGSAKGWAADRAAERLAPSGPALVDAGGDIAVSGPRVDGAPWPIAVASPFEPGEALGVLLVEGGGVATSGRDRRRWQRAGRWQHHVLDPRTGRPAASDVLTATVTAASACEADVAAKVILILGSRDGLRWLEARPGLAAVVAREDGVVLTGGGLDRLPDGAWRPQSSLRRPSFFSP